MHHAEAHAGLLACAVRERGHLLDEWSFAWGTHPPRPLDSYDAVVVLGGPMHADQDPQHPWLARELVWLERLLERRVPVLGICLGLHLLARAAGSPVARLPEPEIGWHPVELTDAGAHDPVMGRLPPRFAALQWHECTCELPAGAVELARGQAGTQAYRLGDACWAVQFHPEVTHTQLERWITRFAPPDPARLRAATDTKIAGWNTNGRSLCAAFMDAAIGVVDHQAREASRDHVESPTATGDPRAVPGGGGYERRIGRYTHELAGAMLGVARVRPGQRALDLGCGSGPLTSRLADLLGAGRVAAIDADPAAARACAARLPGVDVRLGRAESLPFATNEFDAVLAQLLLGLLTDPAKGVSEMRRVARPGAPVTACVWDFAGGMTVLRTFWDAARSIDRQLAARHDQGKTYHPGTPRELDVLWRAAGLANIRTGPLHASARYANFEDLWQPLVLPDGTPGRFHAQLHTNQQRELRERVWRRLGRPKGSFRLDAQAWYVTGEAPEPPTTAAAGALPRAPSV